MAKPYLSLIYKDFLLELKNKSTIGSILLYLISTVFISYLAFEGIISDKAWNALFWIIVLFTAFNAVLKGFVQEGENRNLYYYKIVKPTVFINSKIIYNTILLLILIYLAFTVFVFFMGNAVENLASFLIVLAAGVIGLASILTLTAAIASKVRNNFTLVTVLSFPVVLPQLIIILNSSEKAITGAGLDSLLPYLLISLLISFIAIVLTNVLFPYIWKE